MTNANFDYWRGRMHGAPCDAALSAAWFTAGPDRLTGLPIICKLSLTGESRDDPGQEATLIGEGRLPAVLTAVANPHRMRVIAELGSGRVHVRALARRL